MKNRITFFAFICCLLLSSSTMGQDFIKDISWKLDSSSIIRTIDEDNWLVYSIRDNVSSFTFVSESGLTAPTLVFPTVQDGYYVVNDFEILNDSVFFCGYKKRWQGLDAAFFGYFDLGSILTSNVLYCYELETVSRFDKIDLYDDGGKPHIVMTGVAPRSVSVIVDARVWGPNYWAFDITDYSYHQDFIDPRFDDVAVTDDYVFVTTRELYDGSTHIQKFAKPASYTSIFGGGIVDFPTTLNNTTPILIEHCFGNVCSILTSINSNTIVVGFYDENGGLSINETTRELFQYRDLKVNPLCPETVDILLKMHDLEGNEWSEIITSVPMTWPGPKQIAAEVHKYLDHDIYSMDFISAQNNIIASGQPMYGGYLYVYRCLRSEWNCEEKEYAIFERASLPKDLQEISIMLTMELKYANLMECSVEKPDVKPVCGQEIR